MIVKPAEAGGAELPAPTDGPAPDADDDADAVDALTGVGHDLPSGGGEAAAPGREVDADAATARGGAAADDAPARPTATPAEDDESAKMLMLLGELGGADDSSAEEEEEEEEEEERGAGARLKLSPSPGTTSSPEAPSRGGGEDAVSRRRLSASSSDVIAKAPPPEPASCASRNVSRTRSVSRADAEKKFLRSALSAHRSSAAKTERRVRGSRAAARTRGIDELIFPYRFARLRRDGSFAYLTRM